MADIYLTKIERKTIFTRALIYVLILFVVADVTVTGPFFINFIPWLYIFSVLIGIRGVDKVLTGIIGTFTVFISSLILNGGFNTSVLLNTLNAFIQLGLGMLTSYIIHQFVLNHRLVKYIKPQKKIVLIVLLILFTLLSFVISSAVHGDVFTYSRSKARLDEYISKVYDVEYEVEKVIYNRNLPGKYAYIVKADGEEIQFVPVLNIAFKDANQKERLEQKNSRANIELKNKLEEVLMGMKVLDMNSFNLKYEYTKVGIKPDNLILYITAKSTDNAVHAEIANSIISLTSIYPNITEINVILNERSLHIPNENISLVTPEYIQGGFNIEDLDE